MKEQVTQHNYNVLKVIVNLVRKSNLHSVVYNKSRDREKVLSRVIYFKLCFDAYKDAIYTEVAGTLQKDHSTICHSNKVFLKEIGANKKFTQDYNKCIRLYEDYYKVKVHKLESFKDYADVITKKNQEIDALRVKNLVLSQKCEYSNKKFKELNLILEKLQPMDVSGAVTRLDAYAKMCDSQRNRKVN